MLASRADVFTPWPCSKRICSSSLLLTLQRYLIAGGLCSVPASRAALFRLALHHTMVSLQTSH